MSLDEEQIKAIEEFEEEQKISKQIIGEKELLKERYGG